MCINKLTCSHVHHITAQTEKLKKQEVKVIWQKAPHGGAIPRLRSPQGVESCTIEFLRLGFLLVLHSNYRPRMHRLATVHARDNQPVKFR